jgi:DNA-binding MarR family transcriptional regulator
VTKKTPASHRQPSRRRRVGKLRGGKNGWEPRSQILARVERVVLLHEQGQTQEEIARDVGVSQAAVSKILQRVDLRGLAVLDQQLAALKMRRLRMLEYMSREGRRAWEHSKQGRVRKRQRKATSPSGSPIVTHEILVDEQPDPRMLDQARKAEEVIAAVCGFTGAAPRGGRALAEPPVADLTPEEIAARLNALLDEAPPEPNASDVVTDMAAPEHDPEGDRD